MFFAIWWAWMNFTWFASSYDTDDVPYRLLTMVQMAGVLVPRRRCPGRGRPRSDYRAVTLGYLIMRIGLVAQWLRAAIEDPDRRRTALRYAVGIAVLQVGWILRLSWSALGPQSAAAGLFVVLVVARARRPALGRAARDTNWHPHHIAERYGLFTIILLGESVLAASRGVQNALAAGDLGSSFVLVAGAGLVLLFALWWLYFLHPAGDGLSERGPLVPLGLPATTASSPPWPPSAPGSRSPSSRPRTTPARPPLGTPSRSRSRCSCSWCWLVHAPIIDPPVTNPP